MSFESTYVKILNGKKTDRRGRPKNKVSNLSLFAQYSKK